MRLLKRNGSGGISFTKDLSESELPAYKYAILSHTWGEDEEEVTYEDIVNGTGTSKPGIGSAKIRFCIKQTRQDGLDYFWSDTCCIDKRNLVELDRSLRSMFRWYANAEKCYVFLADVPQNAHAGDRDELRASWKEDFRVSRWFRRGWTLQELIAPATVEFFDKHGSGLGTKRSLENEINHITRIPVPALRGKALTEFSRKERRQWQEGRETREEEDLVYSLLGLLDISMPVLYGEGRIKAWERLESAITVASKGLQHEAFSLTFSLAAAAVETQHFVARKDELQEMREHLRSDGSRKVVVLHGLGGIGKTQLAMAYAKRHRDDYSALLWLNAKDETSARSSFAQMAKQILRDHPSTPRLTSVGVDQNLGQVIDAVKSWLSMPSNTRWLLICDNYDNPKVPGNTDTAALDLRQFLPEAYQGSVIVTTRSSEVKLGHCMRITKLEKLQDSFQVLEQSSGRSELKSDNGAVQLVKMLDGLPLALATAGAYLSQSMITCDEYLHFFKQPWTNVQKLSPALDTYENRTLFSTWQISYEQVKRKNSVSAELLHLWAYFDNQDLWFELLEHTSNQNYAWMRELTKDRLDFDACMRVLCNHGLVELNATNTFEVESRGYSVHACVHTWMSAVLNADYDHNLARVALECVASHVPNEDERKWSLIQRRILDHANRCISGGLAEIYNDPDLAWVYFNLGVLYAGQSKLAEAEQMYKRALNGQEKALGAENVLTLNTTHNLGSIYSAQGKLVEAEQMYKRALRGFEKVLGAEDISALATIHNLGNIYTRQGKSVEAEQMYKQALKGCENALGIEAPSTLNTINCLGDLYSGQGKFKEAEQMLEQALRGYEMALGAEHTLTLDAVHNLGNLYVNQGKLVEAEQMLERALRGSEKALGAEHSSTLSSVEALGAVYAKQRRLAEAEQMLERALRGTEKALGAEHSSTLQIVVNLGFLRLVQGRIGEARAMYHRARDGYEGMNPSRRPYFDHLEEALSELTNTSRSSSDTDDITTTTKPPVRRSQRAAAPSAAAIMEPQQAEASTKRGLKKWKALFRPK